MNKSQGLQTRPNTSCCQSNKLSLASVKSRLVLPFWYRLTWVVPEKPAVKRVRVCVVVHFFWLVNVCFCCVRFSFFCAKPRDLLGGKRLQNDLFCVDCDVKPQLCQSAYWNCHREAVFVCVCSVWSLDWRLWRRPDILRSSSILLLCWFISSAAWGRRFAPKLGRVSFVPPLSSIPLPFALYVTFLPLTSPKIQPQGVYE